MISAHERFLFTSCDTSNKRTGECFDTSQRGNKIAKALSTISCINFRRTRIFFPFQLRLEANKCENATFVQSETTTIALHSVNLSMYEIVTFSTLSARQNEVSDMRLILEIP